MKTRLLLGTATVLLFGAAPFVSYSVLAQQTTPATPEAATPETVDPSASSDDPLVRVNLTGIHEEIAAEFNAPLEDLVAELELPADVAAAACGDAMGAAAGSPAAGAAAGSAPADGAAAGSTPAAGAAAGSAPADGAAAGSAPSAGAAPESAAEAPAAGAAAGSAPAEGGAGASASADGAAGASAAGADAASASGSSDAAACTATVLAPELIEYLRTAQDAQGDEIPDELVEPPENQGAGAAGGAPAGSDAPAAPAATPPA